MERILLNWIAPEVLPLLARRPTVDTDFFTAIVESGIEESDHVDLKDGRSYEPSPKGQGGGWLSEQEFAKDVAAFANSAGGWIIIGVADDGGSRAIRLSGITRANSSVEETRLRQALATYAAPVPEVAFYHAEQSGEHYTVVSIAPSDRAPHAVRGLRNQERRPHYFPIRDGADTRWMNEPEIADQYRRRQSALEDQRKRVDRLRSEGHAFLKRGSGLWSYISVTPEFVAEARLNRSSLDEAEEWLHSSYFASPNGSSLSPYGRGMAKPGRATFTDSDPNSYPASRGDVPLGIYAELFPAGQFFGACSLKLLNQSGVNYAHLRDDLILLSGYGLAWAISRLGAFGRATVEAGVYGSPPLDAADLEIVDSRDDGEVHRRRSDTRRALSAPYANMSVDLADAESWQGSMRACYLLLTEIGQGFGIAEADGLREDGSFDRNGWLYDLRQIAAWCQRYGIDFH